MPNDDLHDRVCGATDSSGGTVGRALGSSPSCDVRNEDCAEVLPARHTSTAKLRLRHDPACQWLCLRGRHDLSGQFYNVKATLRFFVLRPARNERWVGELMGVNSYTHGVANLWYIPFLSSSTACVTWPRIIRMIVPALNLDSVVSLHGQRIAPVTSYYIHIDTNVCSATFRHAGTVRGKSKRK